jgi:hypothetical protein
VAKSVKTVEAKAVVALEGVLNQVPAIKLKGIEWEPEASEDQVDSLACLNVSGRRHVLDRALPQDQNSAMRAGPSRWPPHNVMPDAWESRPGFDLNIAGLTGCA